MTTAKRVPAPQGRAHLDALRLAGEDIHAAVETLHATFGSAFSFGFGPIRFAWFVGRDAAREILYTQRDAFSQQGGYDFLKPVGGATALINSDEPEHRVRRRVVQPGFHGRELGGWIRRGESELAPWFASLAARGATVDLYRGLRPRLVRVIAAIVLGDSPLARNEAWLRDVDALMDFPGRPMLEQQWKVPLPGTPWARFVRARRRVDRLLYTEIARRRTLTANAPTDAALGGVLDLLLPRAASVERPGPNHGLSDKEIRDQSLSLISAGFDTTSAAVTWVVALGLEHPELFARVAAELADGDPVAAQQAPFTDAFVKETLRLRPPAAAVLRRTVRPVEVAGFALPARSRVALSVLETHRDPDVFDEPLAFRPERFLDATFDPFAYLPFGYGARHCIGAGTSTALIKTALATLLGGYTVSSVGDARYVAEGMTLHPRGGLPVRLTAKGSLRGQSTTSR